MTVSRKAVVDYLDRRFESFEWIKKVPPEQILRELSKFKVRPVFRTDPWRHQLQCFFLAMTRPEFLFLLDMGGGKTKLILDIITQLIRERRIRRALVGVPRAAVLDGWVDGVAAHTDLEAWPVTATDIEEKWEQLANPRGDITIVDYQSLSLAVTVKRAARAKPGSGKRKAGNELAIDRDRIRHLNSLYDFTNWDESQYLANHNSLWYAVAHKLSAATNHTHATTGTLLNRDLEAAWAQFSIVDKGETFGPTLGLFRAAFFDTKVHPFKGIQYVPRAVMSHDFHRMLQHRSIAYTEEEIDAGLPPKHEIPMVLKMGTEQREHYLRALEGVINSSKGSAEIKESQWFRMRQISSGYLAWEDGNGSHKLVFKENPKLIALRRVLDEIGHRKLVVVYQYTETGRMIHDWLRAQDIGVAWYYGGTKDKGATKRRFVGTSVGACQVFLMNFASAGTGTDGLQAVSSSMFMYETPTSPMERRQTVKRLWRPGQSQTVRIWDPILERGLDAKILRSLKEGADFAEKFMTGKGLKNLLTGD